MLKITIPTPCNESWDAMLPNDQGRHCHSCVKTVVDFTQMNDEQVKYFLLNSNAEHVCGRFNTQQLHRISIELPQNIFQLATAMPWWKRFLLASLLAFSTMLFSCSTSVSGATLKGEMMIKDTVPKTNCTPIVGKLQVIPTAPPPTTQVEMGEVAFVEKDTAAVKPPQAPEIKMGAVAYVKKDTVAKPPTHHLMGKPAIHREKPNTTEH
jgi:hypothetical protein